MANIPVERTTSAPPWWLWLLGLLLLGLIAWFIISALSDDEEIVEDPIEVVDEPVAAGLDLSDVYVTRVVGDNTFFVAPTEAGANETLVYLEEETTPNQATEGRYDVTEGQHLSITGEMLPVGDLDVTEWGLTPEQAALVGDEYIRATSLTVLDGAAASVDGVITDLEALSGDLAGMVGQRVDLEAVQVTDLAGDSTFYVGSGANRVLVVLEDLGESENGPGTGADGAFDINTGDVLNIDAEIMAFARGMRGTSTLDDAMASDVEARRFVLVVNERGELTKM